MINDLELKALLVYPGYISDADFELAKKEAKAKNQELIDYLVDFGLIKDEQIGKLIAEYKGFKFVDLRKENISKNVLNILPETVAKSKVAILFFEDDNKVKIGMVNPSDFDFLQDIKKLKNKEVEVYFITKNDFKEALKYYKKKTKDELKEFVAQIDVLLNGGLDGDEAKVKLVDMIIENAIYHKASDIHIEPKVNCVQVRYRLDGILKKIVEMPLRYEKIIVSRIKILARMKTDDHFSAQDGKIKFKIDDKYVDIRVSSLPIVDGENLVMRILSKEDNKNITTDLGFSEADYKKIKTCIKTPNGMMLVSGPTGCGKTTTLYELIKKLNKSEVHISTIEDPVEFNIEGLSQVQVNPKTNLTFANGLRAIVRQDPDIIMIGEIRDLETANIAINSAMTGHFVLSSFHAKSASATLPRLIDMGVEPFLVASSVNVVVSQKLVRKICDKCKSSYSLDEKDQEFQENFKSILEMIKQKTKKDLKSALFFKGAGCSNCANTGYKDRIGIFEVLVVTEAIRKLISQKASEKELFATAKQEGMTSILEDGVDKILNGTTTIEEVMRVVIE